MKYWCWERDDWGKWDVSHLKMHDAYESLIRGLSSMKAITERLSSEGHQQAEANLLEAESLNTSLIEGNVLDRDSVKASIAKRAGLNTLKGIETRDVDGLIETLSDAIENFSSPLDKERLYRWHASIFPRQRNELGMPIKIAEFRQGDMEVVTQQRYGGKETLHFKAPPAGRVESDMQAFLNWFNQSSEKADLLRAAIASYWFICIHPFEDGNGRLARAIGDLAIAQAERCSYRLYSFSSSIKSTKKTHENYYRVLEGCQRGELLIDEWVIFFFNTIEMAIHKAESIVDAALAKAVFWDKCRQITITERQKKFLLWVLDQGETFDGHIKRQRYAKIVGKISPATAKRDLQDLRDKGILTPIDTAGRNAGYRINAELLKK